MPRVRLKDFEDYEWSFGRPYLSLGQWTEHGSRESHYHHPMGLVEVSEWPGRNFITAMRFIHGGFSHNRRWETSWGDKTLARLAREFIEDVIEVSSAAC